jgi:hypothetical protein
VKEPFFQTLIAEVRSPLSGALGLHKIFLSLRNFDWNKLKEKLTIFSHNTQIVRLTVKSQSHPIYPLSLLKNSTNMA